MSITYKWRTLAECAAYFEGCATRERESMSPAISKRRNHEHRLIAATYENVAHVLRNTVITSNAPEGGEKTLHVNQPTSP